MTILNFFLLRFGPMNEERLVKVLICSQVKNFPCLFFIIHRHAETLPSKVAGSILAFVIRYGLAGLVYDGDRR